MNLTKKHLNYAADFFGEGGTSNETWELFCQIGEGNAHNINVLRNFGFDFLQG